MAAKKKAGRSTKKAARGPGKKTSPKKASPKRASPKRASPKKAKKAPPRKAPSKKAKAAARKAPSKKAPSKKAPAKKAKASARKAKKAPARKAKPAVAQNAPTRAAGTRTAPARAAAAPKPAPRASLADAPRVTPSGEMYKGEDLSHHPVSMRLMNEVAHEGLRGDGEILHVEENEFAPCRLVDHGEGRFSLCLDDFRMPDVPLFHERGLQGGGYTWEAVVDSLVRQRRPDLEPDLAFDSEAGMFVALGSRDTLRAVSKLIQEAIRNPAVLQEAVDAADPDRLE
jgi:hypothetical protein